MLHLTTVLLKDMIIGFLIMISTRNIYRDSCGSMSLEDVGISLLFSLRSFCGRRRRDQLLRSESRLTTQPEELEYSRYFNMGAFSFEQLN